MSIHFLLDESIVFLLSPWKPVLIFIALIAWGWLFSTHLDKDAQKVRLNVTKWNWIQMTCGGISLFIMYFGGVFYIAYPIGLVVMIAPILLYWKVRNEEVPDEQEFHIKAETFKKGFERRKTAKVQGLVSIYFDGKNGRIEVPEKDTPAFDIYTIADDIIKEAITNRSNRLELQLSSKECRVAYLVDGFPIHLTSLPSSTGAKIIAMLKEAAGTDPTDVRRRQIGSFKITGEIPDTNVDITTSGSSHVHILRVDFERAKHVNKPYDSIGLLPTQRELLDQLKDPSRRHGIVLLGGGNQSGLTTTGYSILSQHDSYLSNIVTLEQDVFHTLEGITHQSVHDHDQDYATQLQTIIRRDPEVILAADLKEADAAKMAAKPGKDGPLIFISIASTSMKDLVSKWANMVADPRAAFGALQAVMHQKLVRKLCENCRVAYKPSPDLAKQGLSIENIDHIYRQGGHVEHKNKIIDCPVCGGAGYMGQIGVFETMFLDSDTRKHLIAGDLKGAMAHARRKKCLIRLHDAAWLKVADGQTSLEEFGRVSTKSKTTKKKASSGK